MIFQERAFGLKGQECQARFRITFKMERRILE